MEALFEYLSALFSHWVWFMTSGPFVVERILRQFWTGYDAWAAQWLSPAKRLRIGIGAAVAGMFWASFLAFSDEKTKLDLVNANVLALHHSDYLPYDPIPPDKIDALTKTLQEHGKHPIATIAADGDASTVAILEQIQDAFDSADLELGFVSGQRDSDKKVGILLYVHDPKNPSEDTQFYIKTVSSLGIPVDVEPIVKRGLQYEDFIILVCPRQVTVH